MAVAADWPVMRRELRDDAAVTMGEPSSRLHDTCTAARGQEDARIMLMLMISEQLQSLTGADGNGGGGGLHLREGVCP